ncbi:MAG TPA: TonB-dependent receptor [Vicinamibacterales bacterium]|nr:TonB-dependent receptor [Vicinamibacterales bacterium]
MFRPLLALFVVLSVALPLSAHAQTGQGSLRGYVRDSQGGALPGVTITATAPELLRPATVVTNEEGLYRLINLPPGTYTLVAELAGFSVFKREGILLRAGATFAVDIELALGTLEETITVSGDSPMIEVLRPGNALNIDGEFQRNMPIQARRNWSDFLELTPGIISRGFDDGSGRQVYFGHATEHFAHVVQLEGMIASNYHDAQLTYVAMGTDIMQDISVKTGGVDASAPMGVGMVINVLTKSGGNRFSGAAGVAYQPFSWNGNNVANCTTFVTCNKSATGTPTTAYVRQFDGNFGGPIKRDSVWFFGALRRAVSAAGISRTSVEVERLQAFFPGTALFDNTSESWQPYLKVSGKLKANHDLNVLYQNDRLILDGNREYNYQPIQAQSTGGSLYGTKLTSVWGDRLTSTFTASYNNKGGNDVNTFTALGLTGPQIIIHERANITGGRAVGTGRLLEGGNLQAYNYQPASQMMLRGDLTYFKDGWRGSHEFQTGFFAAPRSTYDQQTEYVNDGFVLEQRRMVDPNNPAAGTVPFQRQYRDPVSLSTREAVDRNVGFYVQDNWRPTNRLAINAGVRFDWVQRNDNLFDIKRQDSWQVGPRLGFSYMVTEDAKNVLRASYVRVHEQMMGRDAITTFGAGGAAAQINDYDVNLDGRVDPGEGRQIVVGRTASLASNEIDPNMHQPYVDEFILGFRKQFRGQWSADVAWMKRSYQDMYAEREINGFWPSGPNQPFEGFGRIDANRGLVYQQTNNEWSTLEWQAFEMTVAKNLSNNFQALVGINRQWQEFGGTWNPRDPARFIQPGAFPSNKLLYMPRGNNEENSLPINTGTTVHTYGPTWQKYSLRFGGTYHAPFGIIAAASYTILAGPWSGPLVDQLPVGHPSLAVYGPSTFRLANGTNASNPLSTRLRFVNSTTPGEFSENATRGEGQVQAPAVKTLGLKIGKTIRLGGSRDIELAGNIFNLLNAGDRTQYNYSGANERFNPNFLLMRNQQAARGFQATVVFKF